MPEIRPASPADLDACYEISLATAFEGGDASHLYADRRLMGHIYVAPYLLLAPTLAFVVEDRCGVAGFAVGTADTVAWEQGSNTSGGRRCANSTTIPPASRPNSGQRTSGGRS